MWPASAGRSLATTVIPAAQHLVLWAGVGLTTSFLTLATSVTSAFGGEGRV